MKSEDSALFLETGLSQNRSWEESQIGQVITV